MFKFSTRVYERENITTLRLETLAKTFKVDEALDSGLIRTVRKDRKKTFQRFAPTEITVTDNENNVKRNWWLIFNPSKELTVKDVNVPLYDHTLGLIEPTKWLEKFSVGTLNFTQPLIGIRYTMKTAIERVLNLTPFVPYFEKQFNRLIELDSTLATYLDTLPAPQMYFDKKNLREVLILMFRYFNAIPRMSFENGYWVLSADFINKRRIPINIEDRLIELKGEASGEYYGQKAEIFYENTVPTDDETITTTYESSKSDFISFKTNELKLSESNFEILLSSKCYRLLSIKASVSTSINVFFEVDITDCVYESEVYETLEFQTGFGTRDTSAFWKRGSNVISGFNNTFNIFDTSLALKRILDYKLGLLGRSLNADWTYQDTSFRVEYITRLEQTRSEQYREDMEDLRLDNNLLDRYSMFIVNPAERINESYQLTANVHGQVQRLGVDTVSFSRKHLTIADFDGENDGIYKVGDYTEDGYFVTTVNEEDYNNFVIAKYEMSKEWNRIAQFVQIDKEFRPYEVTLTKSDFSLQRNVLMRFGLFEVSNTYNPAHNSNPISTFFMNTFLSAVQEVGITGAMIERAEVLGDYEQAVYLPTINIAEKNTIKFKIDFLDTKVAGRKVVYQPSGLFIAVDKVFIVPYTEDDGSLNFTRIKLFDNLFDYLTVSNSVIDGRAKSRLGKTLPYVDPLSNLVGFNNTTRELRYFRNVLFYNTYAEVLASSPTEDQYAYSYDFNEIYLYSSGVWSGTGFIGTGTIREPLFQSEQYNISKDPSEILSLEMTMPVLPKSTLASQYIIGDRLIKDNILIRSRTAIRNLYWYTRSEFFNKAETNNIGTSSTITPLLGLTISGNRIIVPPSVLATNQNFALADVEGNLFLAVNRINYDGTIKSDAEVNIYFNYIAERS